MTRESLFESTALALDEAIAKVREEIMAGRSGAAGDYAEVVAHLSDAFVNLEEE